MGGRRYTMCLVGDERTSSTLVSENAASGSTAGRPPLLAPISPDPLQSSSSDQTLALPEEMLWPSSMECSSAFPAADPRAANSFCFSAQVALSDVFATRDFTVACGTEPSLQ